MLRKQLIACFFAAALAGTAWADNARFDLVGPKVDVRVTRGGTTLPIAQVPNLLPGDKLWVKADLPESQSNHLLLIVAFLRGTTNEPPDNWFTEIDTWEKRKTAEGTTVTVPQGAEQALLFIAPETGGDFKTLRSAVKGKPGLFIRADADLNEASFEQQRIEHYLAAMKTVATDDQKEIQDRSAKLAGTLALKPNADCFKQPVDNQVNCLTQSSAPVLLDDGHGQSIATALSTGASSDFINAASATGAAGGGLYSAYVGAVVDLVHLVSTLHTAKYQYIPGLSFPQGSTLNLKLNAAPSFHDPKSVIVIGLPGIQKAKLPPLRAHDPNEVACLLQPRMTLPLEGAPLVFSTTFAHDLVLHLNRKDNPEDIPLTPDAFEGGLVVAKGETRKPLTDVKPGDSSPGGDVKAPKSGTSTDLTVTGTVRGFWGFDAFDGPTLTVQQLDGKNFRIVGDTQLLAGQENHLTLRGDGTACVQRVVLTSSKDKDVNVNFKPASGDGGSSAKDTLALDVSMKKVQPGGYSLGILQFGAGAESKVPLTAYASDIHLADLKIHAGDDTAVLTGQGVQDVVSVQLANQTFTPDGDENDDTTVHLKAKAGVSPNDGSDATVKLKDGRTMTVKVSAEAARPGFQLLSFKATPAQQGNALPVTLGGKSDIPLEGKLTFVVQTKDSFPRNETVEVATADGSLHTTLSMAANNLVLQDAHTAIATLDPAKAFGQSAFGKLQIRPVSADGTPGDWTPLGTLVRTPDISAVQCTTAQAPTCTLTGNHLFLVQQFGAGKAFEKAANVPTGFADDSISVPTPADGATLYLKLRDDPEAVASVTLPTPVAQPAAPESNTPSPGVGTPSAAGDPAPASASPVPPSTPAPAKPAAADAKEASAPAGSPEQAQPANPQQTPASPQSTPGPAAAAPATPKPTPAPATPVPGTPQN